MIYSSHNDVELPSLDLLSLLFDSEHGRAKEDTPIFAEAKDPKRVITKARARELTKQFAYFLRNSYGIGAAGPTRDDVVVTVSSGQSALPCLFYGVVAAGGIYSAASGTALAKDLARQVRDGPGKVLVCSKELKGLSLEAAKEAGLPERNVLILQSYPEISLESADGSVRCDFSGSLSWKRITDAEELRRSKICLLYSSGTTGLPKAVLVSHTNMVSEVFLPMSLSRPIYDDLVRQGKGYDFRTLGHLPAAHIAGVQGYFVNVFYEGGIVYWMPGFNFDDFLKYCEELKITFFFTVPPIYMAIAKHPAVKNQLQHMRGAVSGAAPLTADLQDAATQKLGNETKISQTWGMSETTGSATYIPPGQETRMGSLGRLLPNVRLRLIDEDEKDVKPGEPGEALVKGPIVTQGYHNNPEANKNAFTADGWLRTGDILQIKDGEFYIVDRKKELIKYKGLQVAPAELEGVLTAHPAILDAAVIGIEDNGNEVPRAYVVIAPPAVGKISEKDVADFVASKVAGYKRLRGGVKFVDAVPRSPSGKILRKDVRLLRKREEAGSKI